MGWGLSRASKSTVVKKYIRIQRIYGMPSGNHQGAPERWLSFMVAKWAQVKSLTQNLVSNSVSRREEAKWSQTPHSSLEISTACEDVILLDDLGLRFLFSVMKSCVWALYMLRIAINNSSIIISDKTMMWVWMTSRVLCSSAIYDS